MNEVDALVKDFLPADPLGTPFDPVVIELREVVFGDKAQARPQRLEMGDGAMYLRQRAHSEAY